MISGISVTSITLLATIISAFYSPEAPDPKKLDSRTKVAYIASKEFSRLPQEEKEKYIKSVGRSTRRVYRQLSSTERQVVSKYTQKVRMKEMKERTKKFFKMNEDEQNKYLDAMNARRDKWRKAREIRRAKQKTTAKPKTSSKAKSSTSSNTNRRGGNRNARMQGRYENMDSTTRAQWMEIRRRAKERRDK